MRKPAEVRALEHKPEIVLDNKDREIINILTINSRTPLSQIAKMLMKGEIDEQEAFSIQAVRYNRKSPYRNVSNDFNYYD